MIPLYGKLIITKKSGAGELTGITELALSDVGSTGISNATFKDLQFTEAGDYVITISSTNALIEPLNVQIKVLPSEDIVEQEEDIKEDTKDNGNRPIIAQIDPPTIKIPQIEMSQDGTGNEGQYQYTQGLGYTPFIWYKGYQIGDREINYMVLYHEGIVPKIRFTFTDTLGLMKDVGTPEDDTTMDLFLNSTSKSLKSIHFKFKIENFKQGNLYTITGTIDVPDLYVITNKSYNNTSFDTLRTVCKEMGLGFNSNISNTEDEMIWRNSNRKPYEFMKEIIEHSYISDESFMMGYIDYYYCFNYVDIEKELQRDISNDVGINTSGLSEQSSNEDADRLIPIRLTNDKSAMGSSNYIHTFQLVNESTKKSLLEGYSTITKAYDRVKKQFMVFGVDSLTADTGNNIILKGARGDTKFFDRNIRTSFTGKLDGDNTHINYHYAKTQNRINLFNLNKICIIANLPSANYNLYKYQKVRVDIINATTTPSQVSIMNNRYSGEYIIIDIKLIWKNGAMGQELRLVRKELSKSITEINNEKPETKKVEEKQVNENPIDQQVGKSPPKPNANYVIGETYLVQDIQNKLYELTIKALSSNGVEVTADIKETSRKNA